MEKAYDPKALLEHLKSKGLDVAEDAAKEVVEAVFSWVEESAQASENKYDDMVIALLPPLKSYILEQVDKIDGEEG